MINVSWNDLGELWLKDQIKLATINFFSMLKFLKSFLKQSNSVNKNGYIVNFKMVLKNSW